MVPPFCAPAIAGLSHHDEQGRPKSTGPNSGELDTNHGFRTAGAKRANDAAGKRTVGAKRAELQELRLGRGRLAASPYIEVPGFVAELALMLWLLVMGVNSQRSNEQAGAAGEMAMRQVLVR